MNTELLYKYLSGACTDTEKKEVEDWLEDSPKNQEKMSEIKRILEVSPGKRIHVDSQKAWDTFSKAHLDQNKKSGNNISSNRPGFSNTLNYRKDRKKNIRTIAYSVAAAAVIFLTFMFYESNSLVVETPNPELVSQEITTERGQRTMVLLSDGTRIHINAESKLSVPQDYMDNRVVRLNGEAFFEVKSDEEKPFIVHTGKSITRVLGTKFNVTAYPDAEEVQVVVAEGKVALGADEDLQAPEVQLTKNQRGVINKNGDVIASNVPDVGMYLDWSSGMLTFKDAPLQDIEKRLERWYNVEVTFEEDVSNVNRRLTGSFKDVSMTNVLKSIALSLDLEYTKDGRKITFTAQ